MTHVRPKKKPSGYVVLDQAEREHLTIALLANGDDRTAREVGASKYALVRAALGLEVQAGTASIVRGWLRRP